MIEPSNYNSNYCLVNISSTGYKITIRKNSAMLTNNILDVCLYAHSLGMR